MKSLTSRILAGLLVVFIAIQFIPVKRSNPAVEQEISVPENVQVILGRSCFDCHSNKTTWPWYAHVAPASWLVTSDVNHGRRHLNFSTWNRYDTKKAMKKLDGIIEVINENEMPLWFYTPLHPGSKLSDSDKTALKSWASDLQALLSADEIPGTGESASSEIGQTHEHHHDEDHDDDDDD